MLPQETTALLLAALTIILQDSFQANGQSAALIQRRISALGSPRPFGSDRPSRAEEFNRTGVLHPEYLITATLKPTNVSQFYYLSPREGPALTLLVSPCDGPISWTLSYVGPPEGSQHSQAQNNWPVKTLVPNSSPLFIYDGPETQNFTIQKAKAGVYRFEIKDAEQNFNARSASTVLLYATSNILDVLPGIYDDLSGKRHHHYFRFKQRKSKKSLTVTWNRSHTQSQILSYCLVVTSGLQQHPSTLCAAEKTMKKHSYSADQNVYFQKEREIPEGLYCLRDTKLTLHEMKYNTTYNFTLYVISDKTNISNKVASEVLKFRKVPTKTLRNGKYSIVNLQDQDGFSNFRFRPKNNVSTIFHILSCGGNAVSARLRGPNFNWEKEIIGHELVKAPAIAPGKRFTLKISSNLDDPFRLNSVKVLATQDNSIFYSTIAVKNPPRVYRSSPNCREITLEIESAGDAKYCVAVREFSGPSTLPIIPTYTDDCEIHRRRRSDNINETCEEKQPRGQDLPLTVGKLQPGKLYLVQITAQMKGQLLSYPLVRAKTRRYCG